MDQNRFLTTRKVSELTTFSRATIDRKVGAGEFPRPIYISQRRKVWQEAAVSEWMAAVAARQAADNGNLAAVLIEGRTQAEGADPARRTLAARSPAPAPRSGIAAR